MIKTPVMSELFTKLKETLPADIFSVICKYNVSCEYHFKENMTDGVLIAYKNETKGKRWVIPVNEEWYKKKILWIFLNPSFQPGNPLQQEFEAYVNYMQVYRDPVEVNKDKPIIQIEYVGNNFSVKRSKISPQLSLI